MMKMNPQIRKLPELVPLYLDDIISGHWAVAGGLQKQDLDPNKHIGKFLSAYVTVLRGELRPGRAASTGDSGPCGKL